MNKYSAKTLESCRRALPYFEDVKINFKKLEEDSYANALNNFILSIILLLISI